jgi:hypothetical protein
MSHSIKEDIIAELDRLPEPKLSEVLTFVRSVSVLPKGASFNDLKFLIGSISKDDLDLMEKVIEEDCERIDYESW